MAHSPLCLNTLSRTGWSFMQLMLLQSHVPSIDRYAGPYPDDCFDQDVPA